MEQGEYYSKVMTPSSPSNRISTPLPPKFFKKQNNHQLQSPNADSYSSFEAAMNNENSSKFHFNQDRSEKQNFLHPFMNQPKRRNDDTFDPCADSNIRNQRRISQFQLNLFHQKIFEKDQNNISNEGTENEAINQDQQFKTTTENGVFNTGTDILGTATIEGVKIPDKQLDQRKEVQQPGSFDSEDKSQISSTPIKSRKILPTTKRLPQFGANRKLPQNSNKKKWNFVKKLGLVRKFIERLQIQSSMHLFSHLNTEHMTMINDSSYVKEEVSSVIWFNQFLQSTIKYLNSKQWLQPMLPESDMFINLNIILALGYTILLYTIPILIVFSSDSSDEISEIGERILPFSLFFFDIFLKCNSKYYKNGNIIHDRKRIFKNYLRNEFIYDFIIIIIFLIVETSSVLNLVVLLKLRDMVILEEIIHSKLFISQAIQTTYTLLKLLFIDIFLAHFFSCGFLLLGKMGGQDNWISQNDLQFVSNMEQYINSFYFSIITMTTVGFGDIHPYNSVEKLYVSIVTMISSGVFGYTLSVIGGVMHEKFQKEAEYKRRRHDLNHYMEMRAISKPVRLKALKYLEYMKQKEDKEPLRGQDVLEDLSLEKGQVFGKDQFFGQPFLLTSAKSVAFSLVISCSQIQFLEVLKGYPEDHEKYCMMRDNLIVNRKPFLSFCIPCKKTGHTVSNCPLMHSVRNREFVIYRHLHSENQERQENSRTIESKFNTLKERSLVRQDLKHIRKSLIKIAKENYQNNVQQNDLSSSSDFSLNSANNSKQDPHSSDSSLKDEVNSLIDHSLNKKKQKSSKQFLYPWGNKYGDDKKFYLETDKIKFEDGQIKVESEYSDISESDEEDQKDQIFEGPSKQLDSQNPDQDEHQQHSPNIKSKFVEAIEEENNVQDDLSYILGEPRRQPSKRLSQFTLIKQNSVIDEIDSQQISKKSSLFNLSFETSNSPEKQNSIIFSFPKRSNSQSENFKFQEMTSKDLARRNLMEIQANVFKKKPKVNSNLKSQFSGAEIQPRMSDSIYQTPTPLIRDTKIVRIASQSFNQKEINFTKQMSQFNDHSSEYKKPHQQFTQSISMQTPRSVNLFKMNRSSSVQVPKLKKIETMDKQQHFPNGTNSGRGVYKISQFAHQDDSTDRFSQIGQINMDQFIPLNLDKMKEFKKYFPSGNFSAQFKEKIKILRLLSRKLSLTLTNNPNLKKLLKRKLSKLNNVQHIKSFYKKSTIQKKQTISNQIIPETPF